MSIILKLIANPVLRAIVSALLQWLVSECAAFVAKYVTVAKPIVQAAETLKDDKGEPLAGKEKFAWAKDKLVFALKTEGVEYKDHFVDTALQTAVGIVKAELEKQKAKEPSK